MHEQARAYVASRVDGMTFGTVVEVGGRNINGTVRDLFDCDEYVAVDLHPGPGVDVVADATEWDPDFPVDCVVFCEVFEHTDLWPVLVEQAARWLDDGGTLIVTCATGDRTPHSAMDGGKLQPDEWYRNVPQAELVAACVEAGFEVVHVETRQRPQDLYLTARKDA